MRTKPRLDKRTGGPSMPPGRGGFTPPPPVSRPPDERAMFGGPIPPPLVSRPPDERAMSGSPGPGAGGFTPPNPVSRPPDERVINPQGAMKKGGAVKKYAKGGAAKSSASRRGDGIAQRGKTKGRMV